MHGGARGSGAQKGNMNAYKHGTYVGEVAYRELRKAFETNKAADE
jgi:hypothetical protein